MVITPCLEVEVSVYAVYPASHMNLSPYYWWHHHTTNPEWLWLPYLDPMCVLADAATKFLRARL